MIRPVEDWIAITIVTVGTLLIACSCEAGGVEYETVNINLSSIQQIESSGNPRAYNKKSGATGAFQITQPVIDEFNTAYPGRNLRLKDMYDENRAAQIAQWYLGSRIPTMLEAYKLPVTQDNVLAAYNAGAKALRGSVRQGTPLPSETIEYQKRYKKALQKYISR